MTKKDVISWSSMIASYVHNKAAVEALALFDEMVDKGIEPNAVTAVSALQASAAASNLEQGKKIHNLASKKRFDSEISVSTALIDIYMKCLSPNEALDVFNNISLKDVVCWAALISGYAQNGMAYRSMELFKDTLLTKTKPDAVAMVKILSASSELGILHQAVCLHGYVIRTGFDCNAFIDASLIELYSKCGSLDNAVRIFEEIKDKDVVIWSAMISGYGMHGQGAEAIRLFDSVAKNASTRPNDDVTFLSVLSALSHSGMVRKGIQVFNIMTDEYRLQPSSDHCGIMVDLLGRIGELNKAMEVINQMSTRIQPRVWGALLGACRIHHNMEIGEVAARNLLALDPNHAGYRILLSNLYAVSEKWTEMEKIRSSVKDKGMKKMLGLSVIEVRNQIHSFVADDKLHPESQQIYGLLKQLEMKMRDDY